MALKSPKTSQGLEDRLLLVLLRLFGDRKSWAEIVGKGVEPDLQFFLPDLVDGVLQFPKEVIDLGLEAMKKCPIGQFLGNSPPIKVFHALANRLWGYNRYVSGSILPFKLYLIEFPTISLSEWVLTRVWHVDHLPIVLRRWTLWILSQ
ncbi:hypothetical protein LINPERHAP1_LOCUS22477 [Linum perenne]